MALAIFKNGGQDSSEVKSRPDLPWPTPVGPIDLDLDEPHEIVQVARFLHKRAQDPDRTPDERWVPGVLGLPKCPEVANMRNGDRHRTETPDTAVIRMTLANGV